MKELNAKVILVPDDLSVFESKWEKLYQSSSFKTPFQSYGFFRAWLSSIGRGIDARIIVVESGGEWKLALPVINDNGDWSTFGNEILDYDPPVFQSEPAELSRVFFEFLSSTDSHWDRLRFFNVPQECMGLFKYFPKYEWQPGKLKNAVNLIRLGLPGLYQIPQQNHPIVNIQSYSNENVQDSPKWRKRLKAFSKIGKIEYTVLRKKEILSELSDFELLHRKKCKKMGVASAFESKSFKDFIVNQILDDNFCKLARLDKLSLNGSPVAYHFGYEDSLRVYWYIPTYDPDLGQHSPGTVMTIFALDEARKKGLEFDFLRGREAYKDRFATEVRKTFRLELFRSSRQKLKFIAFR